MKTNKIFQDYNRNLMLSLTSKNNFTFCNSNKEIIDKLIKEIGICLN